MNNTEVILKLREIKKMDSPVEMRMGVQNIIEMLESENSDSQKFISELLADYD